MNWKNKEKQVSVIFDMRKAKIIGVTIAAIIIFAIAVYALGPLFTNVTVNEEMPTANIKNEMGNFIGVGDGIHDAKGKVILIESDDGSRFLRFENFKATNGPDLFVYLSTDKTASDFVSLGPLKGNIGNQNYLIPSGLDTSEYDNVLIWCKQFSVLFGSAELS